MQETNIRISPQALHAVSKKLHSCLSATAQPETITPNYMPETQTNSSTATAMASVPARFDLFGAKQITDELRADWEVIRTGSPDLRPPFFSPAFIEAVEAARPGIQIGVASNSSGAQAILAFRNKNGDAFPPGSGVNDAHGIVASSQARIDPIECMTAFGLSSYAFHASPPSNQLTSPFKIGSTRAYLADLTVDPNGYEHYLRSTSTTIDRQGQKTRRLQRELGPMRFEFDCRDPKMLERLIDLKCQQYLRTHTFNILGVAWIRKLLFELFENRSRSVKGILNVLYFGQTPVALHYGMTEGDLLHYWYPVYAPEYHHGSPGTQLFLEVAREATAQGYTAIDMGYGEQAYKDKLTNVVTEMDFGLVCKSGIYRRYYGAKLAIDERLRNWKWRQHLKPLARRLLPNYGGGAYCD